MQPSTPQQKQLYKLCLVTGNSKFGVSVQELPESKKNYKKFANMDVLKQFQEAYLKDKKIENLDLDLSKEEFYLMVKEHKSQLLEIIQKIILNNQVQNIFVLNNYNFGMSDSGQKELKKHKQFIKDFQWDFTKLKPITKQIQEQQPSQKKQNQVLHIKYNLSALLEQKSQQFLGFLFQNIILKDNQCISVEFVFKDYDNRFAKTTYNNEENVDQKISKLYQKISKYLKFNHKYISKLQFDHTLNKLFDPQNLTYLQNNCNFDNIKSISIALPKQSCLDQYKGFLQQFKNATSAEIISEYFLNNNQSNTIIQALQQIPNLTELTFNMKFDNQILPQTEKQIPLNILYGLRNLPLITKLNIEVKEIDNSQIQFILENCQYLKSLEKLSIKAFKFLNQKFLETSYHGLLNLQSLKTIIYNIQQTKIQDILSKEELIKFIDTISQLPLLQNLRLEIQYKLILDKLLSQKILQMIWKLKKNVQMLYTQQKQQQGSNKQQQQVSAKLQIINQTKKKYFMNILSEILKDEMLIQYPFIPQDSQNISLIQIMNYFFQLISNLKKKNTIKQLKFLNQQKISQKFPFLSTLVLRAIFQNQYKYVQKEGAYMHNKLTQSLHNMIQQVQIITGVQQQIQQMMNLNPLNNNMLQQISSMCNLVQQAQQNIQQLFEMFNFPENQQLQAHFQLNLQQQQVQQQLQNRLQELMTQQQQNLLQQQQQQLLQQQQLQQQQQQNGDNIQDEDSLNNSNISMEEDNNSENGHSDMEDE